MITVTARNQEDADRQFEQISIDFTNSASAVSAVTNFDGRRGGGKGVTSIDYSINLPVTVNLDVTNKFGDIYLNELQGKCKVNLGYGNFDANKLLNSDNLIDIKFSKASVNWMKGTVAYLKYSEMKVGYSGSMLLDTKFSDLNAEKIIVLKFNFEGGRMSIDNCSAIEGKSKFSDLDIRYVEQSLVLDIQYGSCNVREMPATFSTVNIRNKYGNVSVDLDAASNYSLEADLKFCDIEYPSDQARFSFRSVKNNEKSLKGVIGKGEAPTGKVIVKSEFGNVSLD